MVSLFTFIACSCHDFALLNRSEQALECEETAVAAVATAGPSDDAAAPGIWNFMVLSRTTCNIQFRGTWITDVLGGFLWFQVHLT